MSPVWMLPLSLFIPFFPWLAIFSWWVARHLEVRWLWMMFGLGLVFDLLWGRVLGTTPIILILLSIAVFFLKRFWPADIRFYWPISLVLTLVIFEVYMYLL